MKHTRFAGLLALPLFVACSDRAPTAPDATASMQASTRPVHSFGGTCETAIAFAAPQPGDASNVLRLHIEYACQFGRLGRTTAVAEQVVVFTGPTTATASNTTTYTAANGDQLFATWSGTSTISGANVTFTGPEIYAGGTGRFADATGTTVITGTASFVTNTGQFMMLGTLSY